MKKITLSVIIAVSTLCSNTIYAQDFDGILQRYIRSNSLQFKKSDLGNFIIDNKDHSESLNADVIKIQQVYNGLPVFNAVSTALIKDNKVIYYTDAFEKDYKKADNAVPVLNSKQAFEKLTELLFLKDKSKYIVADFKEKTSGKKFIAKQRLLYAGYNGNLELCYEFILPENDNYWDILISAKTGEIVSKMSLKNDCHFSDNPYQPENSISHPKNKEFYPSDSPSSSILTVDNASYNVFALPVEAPNFGVRTNVANPWILSSSPEGWHSDGTNHYTDTRGNNTVVFATNADFSTIIPIDGGNMRSFNFPFDDNGSTDVNMNAAGVNMFYTSNMAHDILYKFGFTETARNFQSNNFGNGGSEGDPVAGFISPIVTNNSAFVNHPDGTPGEMGIQLWSEPDYLYYNLPNSAANRHVRTQRAPFGTALNASGVTGNILTTNGIDGCTPLPTGSLNNSIGLIKAGSCNDAVKVKNAQNAGAIAAIIYEASDTENLTKMTGSDPGITIPSVKILNSEGEYIKNLLNTVQVNITLKNDPALEKEKNLGFDNGVILHEYVHGLSNRLTGTGYSCLDKNVSAEQMGEGWSDFYALMLTNKPEYTAVTSRGIGTYPAGEAATGIGIRPAKYSTDFSVNNYTYGKTNEMKYTDSTGNIIAEEHGVGFIWASMLWDLHWQYVAKYGYSSDVMANTTNGSTRVLQLVTDALKLQACNPTFIDGRNAILAADQAKTGGVDKCMIWRAFAKRGLGVNASAGSKTDINDQVEDFTVPAECMLATNEVKTGENNISIYPNPAKNEFFINFPSSMVGKASVEIYDMSGKLVSSEDKISPDAKKAISTDKLINGTYMVKVKGLGFEAVSKVIVRK